MLVVLDTNVWREELALNSKAGAALRFYLHKKGAKLVVPEVVRLETCKHLRTACKQWIAGINTQYRQLLAVFGELKVIVLPSEQEIEARISNVFSSVGVEIVDVPFSFESARSSFQKIVNGEPPNSEKDQQFKDGLIWADCLRLLDTDDVVLVSQDRGFYRDKNVDKGLADNLLKEIEGKPHNLRVLTKIGDLLEAVKVDVAIPNHTLALAILTKNIGGIWSLLNGQGFLPSGPMSIKKSLFGTEVPTKVYVAFELTIDCSDFTAQGRNQAVLRLKGDAYYETSGKTYSNLQLSQQQLSYLHADGTPGSGGTMFGLVGAAHIGHQSEAYKLQFPLELAEDGSAGDKPIKGIILEHP